MYDEYDINIILHQRCHGQGSSMNSGEKHIFFHGQEILHQVKEIQNSI